MLANHWSHDRNCKNLPTDTPAWFRWILVSICIVWLTWELCEYEMSKSRTDHWMLRAFSHVAHILGTNHWSKMVLTCKLDRQGCLAFFNLSCILQQKNTFQNYHRKGWLAILIPHNSHGLQQHHLTFWDMVVSFLSIFLKRQLKAMPKQEAVSEAINTRNNHLPIDKRINHFL